MKIKIAVVVWRDATLYGSHEYFESDDKDMSLITLVSVGQVVKETEEFLGLAIDYGLYPTGNAYRVAVTIPKSGIRAVEYIEKEIDI